jgi:peptidoglycan/xylan/chitin deacetylase (PgdA/CDA1 family)
MGFRLDRLATLYLTSPCSRLLSQREPAIPILMYHSIADDEQSETHPYYRTSTSPAVFASHLKQLHEEGYTTCTLGQAIQHLQAATQTTAKLAVITFDDGYHDFYRHALSPLSQYGFTATMFLPTAYIGESPASFKGKNCLTWREVRELKRHGIEFGSHTVTHPQLRGLSLAAINEEVVSSKGVIEEKLGAAVESFAYPFAFPQTDRAFTRALRDLLERAGYRNGVCTVVGRAKRQSDRLFLERLPINSFDDNALFRAKLAGAYDWVGNSQHLFKLIKSRLQPVPAALSYAPLTTCPGGQTRNSNRAMS